MPVLDAVCRKGIVCLPQSLTLPDEYPVKVSFDEPSAAPPTGAEGPKPALATRPAPVVPDLDDYPDLGEDTYEYVAPPPMTVGTVKVRIIDADPQPPVSYRDEE